MMRGILNLDVRLENTFKANYDKAGTSPVWQNPGTAAMWLVALLMLLWPFLLPY